MQYTSRQFVRQTFMNYRDMHRTAGYSLRDRALIATYMQTARQQFARLPR